MIKLIKNGNVITMSNKYQKIDNLDVVIEDDTIKFVTKNYIGKYDEIIDASGKFVMPGLINCHTHLGMSLFRATNDNLNLIDWLTKKIWPIEDKMTDDDMYYTSLLSIIEMIKTGTTTSNDMYFKCDGVLKAIKETGVRSVFSRCLMGHVNGEGLLRINEFIKLYEKNKNNDLITFMVTPHSLYTCSKKYLYECKKLADELKLPIHMHFCENDSEVDNIKKEYGVSPVEVLNKLGYLDNKLILAHGTIINTDELKLLANGNVSIVHNPVSNLNLGCGIADIKTYIDNNINVCLGTDGQGSGNNMNMFYHMSLVDMLQKAIKKDPTVLSSYDVLKMATINGAKALGLDNIIGSIEEGKKADIIIVDYNNIEAYPYPDIITMLVHNTESVNVNTTIINGQVLMTDHKLMIDIDCDDLKSKIDMIIKRLNV